MYKHIPKYHTMIHKQTLFYMTENILKPTGSQNESDQQVNQSNLFAFPCNCFLSTAQSPTCCESLSSVLLTPRSCGICFRPSSRHALLWSVCNSPPSNHHTGFPLCLCQSVVTQGTPRLGLGSARVFRMVSTFRGSRTLRGGCLLLVFPSTGSPLLGLGG